MVVRDDQGINFYDYSEAGARLSCVGMRETFALLGTLIR
jgi:hypothetical protein